MLSGKLKSRFLRLLDFPSSRSLIDPFQKLIEEVVMEAVFIDIEYTAFIPYCSKKHKFSRIFWKITLKFCAEMFSSAHAV